MAKTNRKTEAAPANLDLGAVERKLRADLAEAQELRADLVARLGGGADVNGELEAIDEEIETTERRLSYLADAKLANAEKETEAWKAAKHDEVLKTLESALEEAVTLGNAARELWLAFAEIGGRLTAIQETKDRLSALMHDGARSAQHGAPNERIVSDKRDRINKAVNGLTLPGVIARAVWDSGLGRRGVHLPDTLVEVRPGLTGTALPDPTDAIQSQLAALASIAEAIAGWSETARDQ